MGGRGTPPPRRGSTRRGNLAARKGLGSALAGLLRPSADVAGVRAEVRSAEPDDLVVHRDREAYVRERCVRGEDYHYPAHLVGPGAVNYLPPRR